MTHCNMSMERSLIGRCSAPPSWSQERTGAQAVRLVRGQTQPQAANKPTLNMPTLLEALPPNRANSSAHQHHRLHSQPASSSDNCSATRPRAVNQTEAVTQREAWGGA